MRTCQDITAFLQSQRFVTELLQHVAALDVEDCWIGAGLIRNAIWDHLHAMPVRPVPGSDVDVIYHDPADTSPNSDLAIEKRLFDAHPATPWSVHNQARMHDANGDAPYRNVADAISCWSETATAIAARMSAGKVEIIAPHGIDDLVGLIVRPTPNFAHKLTIYQNRVATKNWARRWPKLHFIDI
ncbi:MAG: nucleotidyltransferase family protein [Pseudomonadota bacterium]